MNWPFRKIKSLHESGIFKGLTDWHSHFLPGVDDGFKTFEDSLSALEYFDSLGVSNIWLTPHIMEEYPNSTEDLKRKFQELSERWKGNAKLHLAAEYMLDPLFVSRLENSDLLTIGDKGNRILIETSYFNPPFGMDDMISRIFSSGFFPVLAHPERYQYMRKDDYRRLHDKGVILQLDMMSTVGAYGEDARQKSLWLLENNIISVIGTDIHSLSSFKPMSLKSPGKNSIIASLKKAACSSSL